MRQEREGEQRRARAVAPGRGFLYGTTLAAVPHLWRAGGRLSLENALTCPQQKPSTKTLNKKGPLTRAFSVNDLGLQPRREAV
jgi:hypothetical protein